MSSGVFELRAMTPADLEEVARLAKAADEFGWTIGNLRDALAHGNRLTVAVVDDGVIAGYCVTTQVIDEAELLEIAVRPDFQGRGCGRALLESAVASVRREGARLMHLEVRLGNERARKMYRCAGFVEVGRRRNYYPTRDGREDALLMTLEL